MEDNINKEYYEMARKNTRTTLFIFLAVMVIVTVYTLVSGNSSESVDFSDTYMQFTGPEGSEFALTVNYDDIISVTTFEDEDFDLGAKVVGYEGKKIQCGTWENEKYGEYYLYVKPEVSTYAVIAADDYTFIMNMDDGETTESFIDALIKLLVDDGYWSSDQGK